MKMLRELRKSKGISMKTLGEYLGVSEAAVSQYETGKREADYETTLKAAEYFGVSVDYLLRGIKEEAKATYRMIPVLGSIPAGSPVEAIEYIIDWEDLPEEMFAGGKEYFGLYVRGDSMWPDFLDGDVVIVHKTPTCESNRIAVVYVNGYDATLKQVKFGKDGSITLQPKNPTYPPRTYSKEEVESLPVSIAGEVVELRRKLK